MLLRNNGFPLKDARVSLDDIDADINSSTAAAWHESVAAFGKLGNDYVNPAVEFHDDALLSLKEYTRPAEAMEELESEQ
jgi:hypothetical protein